MVGHVDGFGESQKGFQSQEGSGGGDVEGWDNVKVASGEMELCQAVNGHRDFQAK